MPKPYVYKRASELGIPVVDAIKPVLVTVTDGDVVLASRANSKLCALARASLRVPGVRSAFFFRSCAFLEYTDRMVRHWLPPSVQKEIVSFDRAGIFASGVYQLSRVPLAAKKENSAKRNALRVKQLALQRKREQVAANIRRIVEHSPKPDDTPEQRAFDARIAATVAKHVGGRIVAGIKKPDAPVPPSQASIRPSHRHRTQYVRDLRDPAGE